MAGFTQNPGVLAVLTVVDSRYILAQPKLRLEFAEVDVLFCNGLLQKPFREKIKSI